MSAPADRLLDAADCPVCGCTGTIVATGCDCPDGHGDDWPDRLCVDCGVALLVDPAINAGGVIPVRRSA